MKKIALFLLAVALLTGCSEESTEPVEEPKKEEVKKEEPKKELTLDEKIKKAVNKELGKETNKFKKRIVKLEISEKEGNKTAILTLNPDESFTHENTIIGMLEDSGDAFQQVFKNKEVEDTTVFWQFTMVDEYGKTEDKNVIKITLSRETFDKIGWDNFDFMKYDAIAEDYWMHDALKAEL